MKKTLNIDEKLLRDARAASETTTDSDAVRLGLESLIRHAAYQRLRALRGSEAKTTVTSRRSGGRGRR
jgi:Arc/MetJ family transcription regulator